MRVLWLSHMLPYPPVSGALQRSHHLLRGAAAKHEVTLLSFTQRALLKTDRSLAEARRALAPLCRRVLVHPIPADASPAARAAVAGLALASRDPYVARWLDSPAFRRDLDRLLGEERFDLIHVDTVGLAPHAARARGVPAVLDHHNVESHMMARRAAAEPSRLLRAYFARDAAKLRRLEARHAARAGANLVVSDLDGERLLEVAPAARAVVCPNGTDPLFFRPSGAEPERAHLLFLGGMSWYPNRNAARWLVSSVWPAVGAREPGARLTIVGADPPEDLRRAAAADPRIRLAGLVDDVRPAFERADVFVCPVRDGGGTRLKLLDAMAMAKPIVSTTLGCEGLGLVAGREYLAADTAEAFAAQVLRLVAEPALQRRLGEGGRRVVLERFAWERIVEVLLATYGTVVSRQGKSACAARVRTAGG